MRTTELFLDPTDPALVHASLTCADNLALVDLAATTGEELDDLDDLHAVVGRLGFAIPAWSARGLHHCPTCTLVAAPDWAIAA